MLTIKRGVRARPQHDNYKSSSPSHLEEGQKSRGTRGLGIGERGG